mgnify:CR=1 FL=1
MRLAKGPPTGAIIPRAAKVDVAAKVDAGVRESGCWPGWRRPGMVIVQVIVHADESTTIEATAFLQSTTS